MAFRRRRTIVGSRGARGRPHQVRVVSAQKYGQSDSGRPPASSALAGFGWNGSDLMNFPECKRTTAISSDGSPPKREASRSNVRRTLRWDGSSHRDLAAAAEALATRLESERGPAPPTSGNQNRNRTSA